MTKVTVWCRHEGDNLIGIGKDIPWSVPSDQRKFREMVRGRKMVCGRLTYETLPPSFADETIFVLSSDPMFQTSSPKHFVISSLKSFKDFAEDLYIIGGAGVYSAFFNGGSKLMPDIVVDCVYDGEVRVSDGEQITLSESIPVFEKNYRRISAVYEQNGVRSALYVRKGEFVEQSVLKRLLNIISAG